MAVLKFWNGTEWYPLYKVPIQNRLKKSDNLADVPDKAKARQNLGLTGNTNSTHFHDQRYYTKSEFQDRTANVIIVPDHIEQDSSHRFVTDAQIEYWNNKVDPEPGKGLSEQNFTLEEKQKLAGIEPGANKYVHPATHPADMIVENSSKQFVSAADKNTWNNHVNNSQLHLTSTEKSRVSDAARNRKIFVQSSKPTSGMQPGDIWIDTSVSFGTK